MLKNTHIWLGNYLGQKIKQTFLTKNCVKPIHIMFCFVDHFEPDWNNADSLTQTKRIDEWILKYPLLARKHRDGDGCFPKHTFFYPAESYNPEHFKKLSDFCRQGFAEVEIHLHHQDDTKESLQKKLIQAKQDFLRHGFIGKNKITDETAYAFIHGNWALNNSRKDGRWCGVNDESNVLKSSGCYADFTLPSAPSETQTSKINSIYYTHSTASRPKSHNTGVDVEVGQFKRDTLMIIQGPLALNWKKRKMGIFPGIENSDVTAFNLPTKDRIDLWVNQRIMVQKKPDWIFVKVHTHGAQDNNLKILLGRPMEEMLTYLETQYNDGKNFILHYVSAREMYNIIKAAEVNQPDQPGVYRDYLILKNF